jgi:hypothetical protein
MIHSRVLIDTDTKMDLSSHLNHRKGVIRPLEYVDVAILVSLCSMLLVEKSP